MSDVGKNILAIDPGPAESAYVIFNGARVLQFGKLENEYLLTRIDNREFGMAHFMVVEQVAAMGMAVGAEVFETVFWSGRFVEAWGGCWDRVKRHEVKMVLCGNMRAKDANIRAAILDRFGPGKEIAVGTKKNPGPLYGVSGDVWSALAVAITFLETRTARCEAV